MRRMYDSTNAADIPTSAQLVGGYIDGRFRWLADDWLRFPDAVKARIAVFASTNDGDVLDVEWGDSTPEEVPGWLTMRRAAGADPSVYVNRSNWQAAKDACAAASVAEPHWWLASYGSPAVVADGTVATQYANEAITGAHYDLSAVADFWPGVDAKEEVKVTSPTFVGQSVTNINLTVGEVGEYDAIFHYEKYGQYHEVGKVVGYTPGVRIFPVYPQVDPYADPTRDLTAQPAWFVVATR